MTSVPTVEYEGRKKCAYCGKSAEYACSYCEEPICGDHTKIIAFGVPMCLKCDAEAREWVKGLKAAKKGRKRKAVRGI